MLYTSVLIPNLGCKLTQLVTGNDHIKGIYCQKLIRIGYSTNIFVSAQVGLLYSGPWRIDDQILLNHMTKWANPIMSVSCYLNCSTVQHVAQ